MRYKKNFRFVGCAIFLASMVLCLGTGYADTLDDNCTVNILNRSVQVSQNGSWSLPNIPSTRGQIRARVTCVRGEQVIFGQTDYFTVENNEITRVPPFQFGDLEPIPVSLAFVNETTKVTGEGETLQLRVDALYADGGVKDVTSASSGINYTSSNPAIASVDANGVLTAHASGTVMVFARNDGASGVVRIETLISGDTDGDGLPDDFEVANGLDPSDPADAYEDQDGDGLSALDEYGLGTGIEDPDSDGDGIQDGEEAAAGEDGFETDPLNPDTDGDGLPDKVEVDVGSSPVDAGDANYAAALTGIEVSPKFPVLVYNTIDIESSVQLTVTGTLIDGSTLNLTSTDTGTVYISSDLSIANFGIEDGRVFAGQDGVAEIRILNAGHETSAHVTVETFDPTPLASLNLPGPGRAVRAVGNHIYVAAGSGGLIVVDQSDPSAPVLIDSIGISGSAEDLRVQDNLLYLAAGTGGLKIYDIGAPASPFLVGEVDTGSTALDVAVDEDGLAYVAQGTSGVAVVDVSDSTAPQIRSHLGSAGEHGSVIAVDTENRILAFASPTTVFTALATDPDAPQVLGSVSVPGAHEIDLREGLVYIAPDDANVHVADISNPSLPYLLSSISVGLAGMDVIVDQGTAFFADRIFLRPVIPYVDVRDPSNPVYQGILDFAGMPDMNGHGVDVADNYAYAVGQGGPGLIIGQIRRILDNGTNAPDVHLVKPVPGEILYQKRDIVLEAEATDDVHVASVIFLVNGEIIASVKSLPYRINYEVPDDVDGLTLSVMALDLAGNIGRSEDVGFTVEPLPAVDEEWLGEFIVYDDHLVANSISMQDTTFVSAHDLTVLHDVVVSGIEESSITADRFLVEGNLVVDGARFVVSVQEFSVDGTVSVINGGELVIAGAGVLQAGDMEVLSGATVTVPDAVVDQKRVFTLTLDVANAMMVDETSAIDLDGKGYPALGWSGPDFSESERLGCHGGAGSYRGRDCVYGRYERARFAGSGGGWSSSTDTGSGGGAVEIRAGMLMLDGAVRASGKHGNGYGGGAGGSVHLDIESFTGKGWIQANGRSTSNGYGGNHGGGGGRISMNVIDRSGFTGRMEARQSLSRRAGAGTIYIKESDALYGHLIVDNGSHHSSEGGTPVRTVGRHQIIGLYQPVPGVWRIEVAGAPWQPSDPELGWGLDGLQVDLDAADADSPVYRIVANTSYSLTVETDDDLRSVIGRDLVGVHILESLMVMGSADLDFGEDRLVVRQPNASYLSPDSTLRVGESDSSLLAMVQPHDTVRLSGLVGSYYATEDLSGTPKYRIDEQIDFNWGRGSPMQGLPSDSFSVRWIGLVTPEHTETYTFYAKTDDGVRVWVNGQLIIDHWALSNSGEYSGELDLAAGQSYPLVVEMFEHHGRAREQLSWSSASVLKQIIPPTRFSHHPGVSGRLLVGRGSPSGPPELENLGDSTITFDKPVVADSLSIGNGTAIFAGGLTLEGELVLNDAEVIVEGTFITPGNVTLTNGSHLTSYYVDAASLSVDASMLVTDSIRTSGDVNLTNGAQVTVPEADPNTKTLHVLAIEVAGTLSVDATSAIDLDRKGYPYQKISRWTAIYWSGPDFRKNVRAGCHGGVHRNADRGCAYGRHERARFAGSAGSYTDGGGAVSIAAATLQLDGEIRANGGDGYHPGGSGGGIHVEVDTLTGTGRLQANGGLHGNLNGWYGGGGRISVYVGDRSGFSGTWEAHGGAHFYNNGSDSLAAGAGTVFVQEQAQTHGHLIADNGGGASHAQGTPVRQVGRHRIEAAYESRPGVWTIEATGEPWQASDPALDWGVDGIMADLDAADEAGPLYRIERNTRDALEIHTSDDLSGVVGQELVGVHTFQTLAVTGGADVEFGEDRLVLLDPAGSMLGADSTLRVGEMNQSLLQLGDGGQLVLARTPALADLDLSELDGQSLVFDEPVAVDNLRISSGTVVFHEGLTVGSTLEIAGATVDVEGELVTPRDLVLRDGAHLSVAAVAVENLVMDAATLVTDYILASGDASLGNGARVTVPGADPSTKTLHALAIDVAGTLSVDGTSVIDLDRKGYPYQWIDRWTVISWSGPDFSENVRAGCHGGVRRNAARKCAYGRHERARFAGSAGNHTNGHGGGAVSIAAAALHLDGEIRANGGDGSRPAGAGGGIHVEADTLTGTGRLQANGGWYGSTNQWYGGGGRISVYAGDHSGFGGTWEAHGGTYSYNNGNNNSETAGAGTIFVQEQAQTYGHLIVDNGGRSSQARGTPIRQVGRHRIESAYQARPGVWTLEVAGEPWQASDPALDWGVDGITVDLEAADEAGPLYRIATNTHGALEIHTGDDLSSVVGQELVGVHTFQTLAVTGGADVDFGEDRLVLLEPAGSALGADSTLRVGEINQSLLQLGDGGQLVLARTPTLADLDLSELDGQTLVFNEPVAVDNLRISSGTVVFHKGLTVGSSLEIADATVEVEGELVTPRDLVLRDGAHLSVAVVAVENLVMDAAMLVTDRIQASGDAGLGNGARVTVPGADPSTKTLHELAIDVAGTLSVDATSAIDLDRKGYPYQWISRWTRIYWSGPDFSENVRAGCYGGVHGNADRECAYGRYERARFAGSAGNTTDGGGVVSITAGTLHMDGEIRANGGGGYNPAGAGGGIHVEADTLTGTGRLQANGGWHGSPDWWYGGGGRISVYVGDHSSFSGTWEAHGGAYTYNNGNNSSETAGAGTIFVQEQAQTFGHLIVDNGGRSSHARGTPMRQVGRHRIEAAYQAQPEVWILEVAGEPWQASDPALDWGVDGIEVDLDAADEAGPLYRIAANTRGALEIHTSDDLSGVIGQELVGVHTFQTLAITGGADVDFGDDRLVILDMERSGLDELSTLRAGEFNLTLFEWAMQGGGNVESTLPLSTQGMRLEDLAEVRISAPALTIEGNLDLDNTALFLESESTLTITGDMSLVNGAVLTVPRGNVESRTLHTLDLDIAGSVIIDASSALDLSGKGYPSNYWSGPDFTYDTRVACHGGLSVYAEDDCSYGRYERARFAGSAGRKANETISGYGGGLLSLRATSILLEGEVRANGAEGYYWGGHAGGAGGGIHIEVDTLSGGGRLVANGAGTPYQGGGSGGRISVYAADLDGFTGQLAAHQDDSLPAGAGTVYIKAPDELYGRLSIDNGGYTSRTGGTPIRHVGRHLIIAVSRLRAGVWQVQVEGEPWRSTDTDHDWGIDGLDVDLDATDDAGPFYRIVRNTRNTLELHSADELSGMVGNELVGVHSFHTLTISNGADADFGGDRVREVGSVPFVEDADSDGILDEDELFHGTEPHIADTDGDYLPDGLEVAIGSDPLDPASGNVAPYITRLVAGPDSLRVEHGSQTGPVRFDVHAEVSAGGRIYFVDLSDPVYFAVQYASDNHTVALPLADGSFEITGAGAATLSAAFAQKQVDVPLTVVSMSELTVNGGELVLAEDVYVGSADVRDATITGPGALIVENDITITGSGQTHMDIGRLEVLGSLRVDGITLVADVAGGLEVHGDVKIVNGAKLTVSEAHVDSRTLYPLHVAVGGMMTVDTSSAIDVSGKGYPSDYWSGPDFTEDTRPGCHGGLSSDAADDCTYGRYEQARFAGSAGRRYSFYTGHGGGLVTITAEALVLDGAVRANGMDGNYYSGYRHGGSGGGGVHIDVAALRGSGRVEANAGAYLYNNTNAPGGGGGRISVRAGDRSGFSGTFAANQDVSQPAGAGTVYVYETGPGHLQVDNGGRISKPRGTPIRHVGRHLITGTSETSPGVWRIQVVGEPWRSSNPDLGWGLDGLDVDLDASDEGGPLYRIAANTSNALEVHTDDDLSGLIGPALVGVHTFQTVSVTGGADVDFGGDRLVLLDPAGSTLDADSTLRVGEMSQGLLQFGAAGRLVLERTPPLANLDLSELGEQTLVFTAAVHIDSLRIGSGTVLFEQGLAVDSTLEITDATVIVEDELITPQDLVLRAGAQLTAPAVDVENMVVDAATLVTGRIQARGNMDLTSSARATVPMADADTRILHPLSVEVAGTLTVDATSAIDVSGKGYPSDEWSGPDFTEDTRPGCHGGLSSESEEDCTYGRHEQAQFAGSAGRYHTDADTGGGGGLAMITAEALVLDGVVRANGMDGYHSCGYRHCGGGAGGGVHIEVAALRGSGRVEANAGSTRYNHATHPGGGGGRISMYVDDRSGFTGTFAAHQDVSQPAGAGTVYVHDTGHPHGHLRVDNDGFTSKPGGTPLRYVGRHMVTGVAETGPGVWHIQVAGEPWRPSDPVLGWGLDGLEVDLDASDEAGPLYRIAANTSNALEVHTDDDLSGLIGEALVGVRTLQTLSVTGGADVDFGGDRLVLLDPAGSTLGADSTLRVGEMSQSLLQFGAAGRLVLERTPALANLDLSNLGEQTLVFTESVRIDSLRIGSGEVLFEQGLTVDGMLEIVDATVTVEGALVTQQDITVRNGAHLIVPAVEVDNLAIEAATLVTEHIQARGNVDLTGGAQVTVPSADADSRTLHPLSMEVAGTLAVDATSAIDVSGKGYPSDYWSGPDFTEDTRSGCHGGLSGDAEEDCTYGRHEQARFAGSAGDYSNDVAIGHGGGITSIIAENFLLDGKVNADGIKGGCWWSSRPDGGGGAGGSIHVEVTTLEGTGWIGANGGGTRCNSTSYPGGGGGRISVHVGDRSGFTGTFAAHQDVSQPAGAGTVYIHETGQSRGHLQVDNGDIISRPGGTPIRHVDRHVITGVGQSSPGVWHIQVAGEPWQLSNPALGWGLDGLEVDLDAADEAGPLYRIVTNTRSTLEIHTSDDLSGLVGLALVGVHTFQTVSVTGGADVDFGGDRLVLLDPAGSHLGADSTLRVGEMSQSLLQFGKGGQLVLERTPALASLDLSELGEQTLVFTAPVHIDSLRIGSGTVLFEQGLTVDSTLEITDAAVTVEGALVTPQDIVLRDGAHLTVPAVEVENLVVDAATLVTERIQARGNVDLTGGARATAPEADVDTRTLHPLSMEVAGTLAVDATSAIDVSGKGYPSEYWSGPDFTEDTRPGCHGGLSSYAEEDCAYGRHEQARFAGSAGRRYNDTHTGHGGGLVTITAEALVLDGAVRANGVDGRSDGGSAGGGVHIDVTTLRGSGGIEANAGAYRLDRTYYPGGGGGRISIYVNDRSGFTGAFAAHQDVSRPAGAGTVYIHDARQSRGHLLVDNGGITSKPGGTPIRHVGRQVITGVDETSPGVWRIEVAGEPWRFGDSELGWGVDGIEVDLDASDETGPLYRIVANTPDTVEIHTLDDLGGVIGQELVGVHTFQTLTISGGADVDFGGDRVVVLE